jgi:hypothetical protein
MESRSTNREVLAYRPDLIIKNKTDEIFLLTDIVIPSDRNVIHKEAEKKLKYKNLSIEIQRMWNTKGFVIPVTTGATGIVSKGLKNIWKQHQENIQQSLLKKKKTGLGISYMTRKVLRSEI